VAVLITKHKRQRTRVMTDSWFFSCAFCG
jgi:hypothetical protein